MTGCLACLALSVLVLMGCGPGLPDTPDMETGVSENAMSEAQHTLGWAEPIDSKKFGWQPDPRIDGKTIGEIIRSLKVGRDDGQLCSSCHNSSDAQGGYGLAIAKNATSPNLRPQDLVGTMRQAKWAGTDGWADRFIKNPTKPASIKLLMDAWIKGGYQ